MARESTPGRINTCMRERGKRGCAKAWGRSTLPMVPNIVEISVKINGMEKENLNTKMGRCIGAGGKMIRNTAQESIFLMINRRGWLASGTTIKLKRQRYI